MICSTQNRLDTCEPVCSIDPFQTGLIAVLGTGPFGAGAEGLGSPPSPVGVRAGLRRPRDGGRRGALAAGATSGPGAETLT